MKDHSGAERRRIKRYPVRDNVFLTFRPDFSKLGCIRDISTGGIAFEYITFDRVEEGTKHPDMVEVDIFSPASDFHLSRVLCKVVYDRRVDMELSLISTESRRCGLKFYELSEQQTTQLNYLMNHYVVNAAR